MDPKHSVIKGLHCIIYVNHSHAEPRYIFLFANPVDSDELAFRKSADQDPHCFPLY